MRIIHVRNASVFATLDGKNIDVEIRTSKDSRQGIAVSIDGQNVIELDYDHDTHKFKKVSEPYYKTNYPL